MTYDVNELSVLRESLNHITIKGTDAKLVASLQEKLERHISDINTSNTKTTTKRTTSK